MLHCLNPVIIFNHSLVQLLDIHRKYCLLDVVHYVTDNEITRWKLEGLPDVFYKAKKSCNHSNIDSFSIITHDGEFIPIFIEVPCGKCTLCVHHQRNEWMARCICETASSKSKPIFFTLTYNNEHLHDFGLCKADVQKFLKRLRSRLSYDKYDVSRLRYFICGEYGKNTKRPHYHGIFWNLPYFENWDVLYNYINDSWQQGFINVQPANDASGRYCMKYLFKHSNKPSEDSADEFHLSSRGAGGIGAPWLETHKHWYRMHPEELQMQVLNPFDNKVYTLPIPTYFKRKLFPPLSSVIPKPIRDEYNIFVSNVLMYMYIYKWLKHNDKLAMYEIVSFVNKVCSLSKRVCTLGLSRLPDLKNYEFNNPPKWLYKSIRELELQSTDYNQLLSLGYNYLDELEEKINDSFDLLDVFLDTIDVSRMSLEINMHDEHKKAINDWFLLQDEGEIDLKDIEFKLKKQELLELSKEIF